MVEHKEIKKKGNALRIALITAVAVMMVAGATMGTAWAYFTTYASAKGGHTLKLGHWETVHEYFKNWNKRVEITIQKDSKPVYVRAKAFCAEYDLVYSDDEVDSRNPTSVVTLKNWTLGDDGWLYYQKILKPGLNEDGTTTADPFYVHIAKVPLTEMEGAKEGDAFNVIIVYETAEVQYDSEGHEIDEQNPEIWERTVNTTRIGG